MDESDKEIYIDQYGNKIYKNSKGIYLDGSEIKHVNGTKYWYKEGKKHKDNGPAIECADKFKEWYKEGLLHRVDGPAIEYANGEKYWCLLNKPLKEKEFNSWMLRVQNFI